MNKATFQKIIFAVLLVLVSGQLFYNTKVSKVLENVENLHSQSQEAKEELFKLKPFLNNPSSLNERVTEENEKMKILQEVIPDEDKSSEHIEFFYSLTQKYGLKGHHIQFERPNLIKNEHQTLYLHVALEGKQTDLLKAMNDIQSFEEHGYVIKDLDLQPSSEGNSILKLTILTYYYQDVKK